MMVVKVCMWPMGREDKEQVLSVATFAYQGTAETGERMYDVRLLKDAQFSKLDLTNPDSIRSSPTWKRGLVRGHFPGRRGVWDLVGGAIKVLLGSRLDRYRRSTGKEKVPTLPLPIPGAISFSELLGESVVASSPPSG